MSFVLETDHKPLVPLLGKTNLNSLTPRILRFRIRLMRFQYAIYHVPGKFLYTADTLSCAPPSSPAASHIKEDIVTESIVQAITSYLLAYTDRLNEYRRAQHENSICSHLITFCKQGWPDKGKITADLLKYWPVRGELPLSDDLLLRGQRIEVPLKLQQGILQKIHPGHQGIQRCQLCAATSVWWPGLKKQMEQLVTNCSECAKRCLPPRQPMIRTSLPNHPWEKVGFDLFELNGKTYIVVVEYFSRSMEVQTLTTMHHINCSNQYSEEPLCTTWHSIYLGQWQRTTG